MSITLPSLRSNFSEFFKARSFMIALKKIVIPAISADVEIEISITILLLLGTFDERATTMHAPPAPQRVEQISPTTSAQNEHTFSEFWQRE